MRKSTIMKKSDLESALLESSNKRSPKTVIAKNGTSRSTLNVDTSTATYSSENENNGSTVPTPDNEPVGDNQNSQVTSASSSSPSSLASDSSSNSMSEILPEAGSKKVDFDDYLGVVPDYDAEYDSIESRLAPISISAREESISSGPDNLPGYPPPNGTSLETLHQYDHADLAADGAGFLFESPTIVKSTSSPYSSSSSSSSPSSKLSSELSASAPPSLSSSSSLPTPPFGTRTSQRHPLPNKSHSRLLFYKDPDQDLMPTLSKPPSSVIAPSIQPKTLHPQPSSKLTQQQVAPSSSLTSSKSRSRLASLASQAAAMSKQVASQQRHSLLQNQAPLIDYNSPLLTQLLRAAQQERASLGFHGLNSQHLTPMRLAESETLANPLLSHTLAANFGNIAAKHGLSDYHARTPASPIFSSTHFGMPAIRSKRSVENEEQSETETVKPGAESILPYNSEESFKKDMTQENNDRQSEGDQHDDSEKTKSSSSSSNITTENDNDLLKSEASGYFAFDDEDPELASLFNLDNSFDKPSPMKTPFSLTSSDRRSRKRRPQTYFPAAQSTKQNFGILGSGNFEIIRGGLYSEDEAKSGSDTHYARGMSETVKSSSNDFDDYNDGSVNSKVPYSTEEYFSNNPVLGFQGYDNFKAASNQQKRVDPNGARRESTASDSSENLHVFVDHELMAAS